MKDKSSQVFFSTVWAIHYACPFTPPIIEIGGQGGLAECGPKNLRTFVLLPSDVAARMLFSMIVLGALLYSGSTGTVSLFMPLSMQSRALEQRTVPDGLWFGYGYHLVALDMLCMVCAV